MLSNEKPLSLFSCQILLWEWAIGIHKVHCIPIHNHEGICYLGNLKRQGSNSAMARAMAQDQTVVATTTSGAENVRNKKKSTWNLSIRIYRTLLHKAATRLSTHWPNELVVLLLWWIAFDGWEIITGTNTLHNSTLNSKQWSKLSSAIYNLSDHLLSIGLSAWGNSVVFVRSFP